MPFKGPCNTDCHSSSQLPHASARRAQLSSRQTAVYALGNSTYSGKHIHRNVHRNALAAVIVIIMHVTAAITRLIRRTTGVPKHRLRVQPQPPARTEAHLEVGAGKGAAQHRHSTAHHGQMHEVTNRCTDATHIGMCRPPHPSCPQLKIWMLMHDRACWESAHLTVKRPVGAAPAPSPWPVPSPCPVAWTAWRRAATFQFQAVTYCRRAAMHMLPTMLPTTQLLAAQSVAISHSHSSTCR